MAKVLAFNFSPERHALLVKLCRTAGHSVTDVPPQRQHWTLGALCGIGQAPANAPVLQPFREEMLVLCGFTDEATDAFLSGWKHSGASPVRLKAMMTPFNVTWTAIGLYREITQEAASFRKP